MLKSRGPRVDPCGTLAIILSHSTRVFKILLKKDPCRYSVLYWTCLTLQVISLVFCIICLKAYGLFSDFANSNFMFFSHLCPNCFFLLDINTFLPFTFILLLKLHLYFYLNLFNFSIFWINWLKRAIPFFWTKPK